MATLSGCLLSKGVYPNNLKNRPETEAKAPAAQSQTDSSGCLGINSSTWLTSLAVLLFSVYFFQNYQCDNSVVPEQFSYCKFTLNTNYTNGNEKRAKKHNFSGENQFIDFV